MASTAENSPQYPFVVIQLSEKCRVIECAADMQWSCKNLTREQEPRIGTVFRSAGRKQPLLRCAGERHPALLALPVRYPDGLRRRVEAGESKFHGTDSPPHSPPLSADPNQPAFQFAA